MRKTSNRAAERLNQLVELLAKPMDPIQLARAAGLAENTTSTYVRALLGEKPRRVHIDDWRRNPRGAPTPILQAGDESDAPRPRKLTPAERMRTSRERARPARRDPLTAALFGPYPAMAAHS